MQIPKSVPVNAPAQNRQPAGYIPVKMDGPRLALFLLTLVNVSRIHQAISIIGLLRPGLLLVALSGLYALTAPKKMPTGSLFKTAEGKLVLWLFFASCASVVFGISIGNSANFLLENFIKVVIATFLLMAGFRNVRDLLALIWAYVVSCGILAFMAVFMFKMSRSGSAVTRLQNLYTFDANDIGVVMMVGLPLAFLIFQHSRGLRKWATALIIVGIAVTLARSGSRGALVGLAVTGLVLVVALKTVPIWKRLSFVGAVVAALIFAAPPGYWDQMATLFGIQQDYNWSSKDGRKELILRGLVYIANYPVFGLGIHNFARAECMSDLSDKVRGYVRGTGLRCSPPHNTYIEAGAETGLVGLALFLSLIFGGIWRLRKLRKRIPKQWRFGDAEQRFLYDGTLYLPVALVGFAVTCFFVSFAWLDILYIAVAYNAGLTVAVRRRLAQDSGQVPAPRRSSRSPAPQRPSAHVALPAT